jgi:hypothetical protein
MSAFCLRLTASSSDMSRGVWVHFVVPEGACLAFLGVIARQEHGLAAEHIRVELEIGVHFLLDVRELRVELVDLRVLGVGRLLFAISRPLLWRTWRLNPSGVADRGPTQRAAASAAV